MKVILLFSKNYIVAKGQIFNIKTNGTKSYHLAETRNLLISERNGGRLRTEQKIHLLMARPSSSFTHVISRQGYKYICIYICKLLNTSICFVGTSSSPHVLQVVFSQTATSDMQTEERKKKPLRSAVGNCASKFGMQCDGALYGNNTFNF